MRNGNHEQPDRPEETTMATMRRPRFRLRRITTATGRLNSTAMGLPEIEAAPPGPTTFDREQLRELNRLPVLDRLRRFVPGPVAEAILSDRMEQILRPHRRDVVVVFFDLRGFSAFAETTEPKEVAGVLRSYHLLIGRSVRQYRGTLERFTGDGTMIFFNDPDPAPDSAERAVRMALALRDRFDSLGTAWRTRGHVLGLGAGISRGYATAGIIGFEERWDYGVIGPVTNLAARLCQAARSGQILACPRIVAELGDTLDTEAAGELRLKGLQRRVAAYSIRGFREPAETPRTDELWGRRPPPGHLSVPGPTTRL